MQSMQYLIDILNRNFGFETLSSKAIIAYVKICKLQLSQMLLDVLRHQLYLYDIRTTPLNCNETGCVDRNNLEAKIDPFKISPRVSFMIFALKAFKNAYPKWKSKLFEESCYFVFRRNNFSFFVHPVLSFVDIIDYY